MRAVRAALAARLPRFRAVLPARLAGFLRLAASVPGFAVTAVDFVFVAVVLVLAVPAGFVVESPVVCPATACKTIRAESRLATHRNASRKTKFVEAETLISPLYAAFVLMQQVGTIPVTQKTCLCGTDCRSRISFYMESTISPQPLRPLH